MATKVKPSRLQVSGTPQAGQVPVYVNEDTFQWGAGGGGGTGDVSGPSSSTDGDIVLFNGATGKVIKDSGKTVSGLESGISANTTAIGTINGKIPSAATSSNQLADKNYVNDSINSVTAYYITKNAQGDQWASYAELAAATTFYSGGVARTPTRNDYAIVLDDETHDDEVTRYIYNNGWEYQYTVNETPLTTAQLNALNSGITSAKVSCYDCCMAQCCDIPTDNCQLSNGCGYVTSAAIPTDNCQLANGCGYITSAPVTSVNGQTGAVTVEEGNTKVFAITGTTGDANLTAATNAYIYGYCCGKDAIIKYIGANFVYARGSGTAAYFTRAYGRGDVNSGCRFYNASLSLTVSSGSVTAIASNVNMINISSAAPTSGNNATITLVI